MTQEDKELLFKDLCARLPYGVFCNIGLDYPLQLQSLFVDKLDGVLLDFYENGKDYQVYLGEVKPYLFPFSSMTEEMLEELNAYGFFNYRDTIANVSHLENNGEISEEIYTYIDIEGISVLIEFFNFQHIDYRGLIEKGLAIDATGLGIY